jgi:hypothetical protein
VSRNLIGLLLTGLVLLVAALWPERAHRAPAVQPLDNSLLQGFDPALAWYTRGHGGGYAGIDRWAHAGLDALTVQARLQAEGYSCGMPQEAETGGPPASGVQPMRCTLRKHWPARDLAITAQFDYSGSREGRLVSAEAASRPAGSGSDMLLVLLRGLGLAEPEALQVSGFNYDDGELLARYVADLLSVDSWNWSCRLREQGGYVCSHLRELRAASGLPPLPAARISAGTLGEVLGLLRDAGFASPRPMQRRGTEDVPVRLERQEMWLDLQGRDLAGHQARLELRLDPHGGAPAQLRVALGDEAPRTLELGGTPRRGEPQYLLLPDAAAQAHWVALPSLGDSRTLDRYAAALERSDPQFVQLAVDALLDRFLPMPQDAEDKLGLRPELSRIETLGWLLRRAGLPGLAQTPAVEEAVERRLAGQDEQRAAWALARCGSADAAQPFPDRDCWLRFAVADEAAANLLRREVREALPYYAGLPPGNPIRLRLEQLGQRLDPAGGAP